MADFILRARAHTLDANSSRVRLFTLHYKVANFEVFPFWSFATLPVLQSYFLSAIHASVGFAVRGLMSPQQGIIRWSSLAWDGFDEQDPIPGSNVIYNVPPSDQWGVYDAPSLDNTGLAPNTVFTLRKTINGTVEGVSPTRAGSIRVLTAPEAIGELPPFLTATSEASAIATALSSGVELVNVPIIDFVPFTAYPVRVKTLYSDEALSSDPDSSNNDRMFGYYDVGSVSFSVVPRYPKKSGAHYAGL